jgi:hypothetical protein
MRLPLRNLLFFLFISFLLLLILLTPFLAPCFFRKASLAKAVFVSRTESLQHFAALLDFNIEAPAFTGLCAASEVASASGAELVRLRNHVLAIYRRMVGRGSGD